MVTRRRLLALVALLSLALGGCGQSEAPETPAVRVRLATTTSTENSGLLAEILPPFEQATGLKVEVVAVGTGQALELARRGDADIVLVHARPLEDAFVRDGDGVDRRDLMYNDFVILGPDEDPAGIRELRDAAAAMAKISAAKAPFVSRGDNSGTHVRERGLWDKAGVEPDWPDYYLEAGQGMGSCLTIADEKRAYILSDRGTYLARKRSLDLAVLVEGDSELHNPYGLILVNPSKHPHVNTQGARRLLEYLTGEEGRRRIGAFRVNGEVLFHPADKP